MSVSMPTTLDIKVRCLNLLVDTFIKRSYIKYMIGDKEMKQRSVAAKALADAKYRQRIVLAKKGKGSYSRKGKKSCVK